MLRGNEYLHGDEASDLRECHRHPCGGVVSSTLSLRKSSFPHCGDRTFAEKVGDENRRMMWTFTGQGDVSLSDPGSDRAGAGDVANEWSTRRLATFSIAARCYRYERRSAGVSRVHEFGSEMLRRSHAERQGRPMRPPLSAVVSVGSVDISYRVDQSVKRGLTYVGDGFEASVRLSGAQKKQKLPAWHLC